MANKKYASKQYDWRSSIAKRGWPYAGDVGNRKYEKDRSELFAKNGNGWWWFVPNKIHNPIIKKMARIKKKYKSDE